MKKYFLFLILITSLNSIFSANSLPVFKKYLNPYFVETGSYKGNGIQAALEAGYEEVHSVEILPKLHSLCKKRFKDNLNVSLWLGNSSQQLWNMIKDIENPITFWLDGHYSGGKKLAGKNSPIIQELAIIAKHPIKTHTIMIDDVRDFGSQYFDYVSKKQIIKKIRQINPKYKIVFEDSKIAKGDILVAFIED